jgi:hypothetical protein
MVPDNLPDTDYDNGYTNCVSGSEVIEVAE